MTAGLTSGIPAYANAYFAANDGIAPIPRVADWDLDWMTPSKAIVTEDYISLGIRGLLFDDLVGEISPSVTIPEMPSHLDTSAAGFQAFVSSWTVDTLMQSYLEVGDLKVWFNSTEVPAWEDIPLTTSTMDASILPGIADYYGWDLPVDTHFNILTLHDFDVIQDDEEVSVTGDVDMQFWVETATGVELAAEITIHDLIFSGNIDVNPTNMNITAQVTKFNIGNIEQISCTWGKLHTL